MKMDRLKKFAAAGLPICLAAGLLAAARKPVSVSLSKKEIRELDGSGLILAFLVRVENSSSSRYDLTRYDYRVVIQGTDYFSLRTSLDEPIAVPEKGETLISLPVKISYSLLFDALPSARDETSIPCYVSGLFIFIDTKRKEQKVPFAFSAEFPLYKEIGVEVLPLEMKALTIGGAEFVFSFSCQNSNAFEVVLSDIDYRLLMGGREISAGLIPGPTRLAAGAEHVFPVPLILDFFELGKEWHEILDQPSVGCELQGKARGSSVWGDLKITISKQQDIAVIRK